MSDTPATTPPPLTEPTVAAVVTKVVDFLVGDILANPRVTKLVRWAMVAAGAIWHSSLGTTVAAALVSGGVLGHAVSVHKETPAA